MKETCLSCSIKLTFVCGVRKAEEELKLDNCPCKDCIVKPMCNIMCEKRHSYWDKLIKIENERKYQYAIRGKQHLL